MTNDELVTRYPRWVAALLDVLIGTRGEACAVIRAHLDGVDYACEACNHSGLSSHDRIRQAYTIMQARRLHQRQTT